MDSRNLLVIKQTLLVLMLILCLQFSGVLGALNRLAYDVLCRRLPADSQGVRGVLALEVPRGFGSSEAKWVDLLERLRRSGASAVVFTFFPEDVTDAFYSRLERESSVFFGRRLLWQADGSGRLAPLPQSAEGYGLKTAPILPPPVRGGIARSQTLYIEQSGIRLPSLPALAAEATGKTVPQRQEALIRFETSGGGVPLLRLGAVLQGQVSEELLKGRMVLIGREADPGGPAYHTPLTADGFGTGELQFLGYSLDSLLQERSPLEIRPWQLPVILVVLVPLGIILQQFLTLAASALVLSLLLPGTLALSYAGLALAGVWLPPAEFLCAELLAALMVFVHRYLREEGLARRMLLDASSEIQERLVPESVIHSRRYWDQILTMVNQTLNIRRSIFLEPLPGNPSRLREVASLNCDLNDISERRRDLRRTPYTTAVEEGAPVAVTQYLKQAEGQDQYLAPLVFSGHLQGYWAFTIAEEQKERAAEILHLAAELSEEIANLLFQRRHWEQRGRSIAVPLLQMLRLERGRAPWQVVRQTLALMESRRQTLQDIFDTLGTAAILYDLFGRVLQVNRAMVRLLAEEKIRPYDLSALELAALLTRHPQEQMRERLYEIMAYNEQLKLPVAFESHPNASYQLCIRLLRSDRDASGQEPNALHLRGFLFELVDISAIRGMFELKDRLFQESNAHLAEDLRSLCGFCAELEDSGLDPVRREQTAREATSQCRSIQAFAAELAHFMEMDLLTGAPEGFPIDMRTPVERSLEELQELSGRRKVGFELEIPQEAVMVMANPEELQELFRLLMEVMLGDAVNGSRIQILAEVGAQLVLYRLANAGYGMPDEDFQRFLFSVDGHGNRQSERLGRLVRKLGRWGGAFRAHSELGKGLSFELRLKRFH